MFNVSQIFTNQSRRRKNKALDKKAKKKVNETKSLLQKGDWGTAEILIQDLIRKHSQNADCCWLFGRLCAHKAQFDTAIVHFKQCIQLSPTHADCYCTYGSTLGILKKYNDEEEMYKKCLELNPSHHLCHFNYGRLCQIKSDYKNAEKHYKQAIEGYNKDSNYYTQYGTLLKTIRRYDEAQKYFEVAITINPNDANTYYLYSKLLQSMGNLKPAISNLKKACKLNPNIHEYQRLLHILNKSKPKITLKRSESVSPSSNVILNICATRGGPNTNALNDLLYNNDINDITNGSLASINDEIPSPPKIINNPFSENDDDAYFKKAVEMYKNKKYDEAESMLKLVITVKPNHEEAQRLYKYLSQKMYITKDRKKKRQHKRIASSPLLRKPSKDVSESKKDSKEDKVPVDHVERDECQMEFKRFLDDRVKLNKQYPDLYKRFEELGYDNIRFVFDFDVDTLLNEVKIKALHCKTFMRKIEVFSAEADVFRKWLKRIVSCNDEYSSMDGLIDRLENKGILTFESLYRFVFKKEDLIKIIGKEFNNITPILWQEIENQQTDLMSAGSVTHSAFSTPISSAPGTNAPSSNHENDGQEEGKITRGVMQH